MIIGVFFSLLLGVSSVAHAQTLNIMPAIVDSSEPVEQALKKNEGRASTSLEGRGGMLSLTYTASEPLEIYMIPLDKDGHFVPTDFLRFALPKTDTGDILVDLTVSPGWSPKTGKWILYLLTKDEGVKAGFLQIDFVPINPLKLAYVAWRHFLTIEAYTPSSYHALRGYRVFAMPFVPIFGCFLLLLAVSLAWLLRKKEWFTVMVIVLIFGSYAYQLRFSVDLLRFSKEHLQGYAAGSYDEAGSAYLIVDALQEVTKHSERKEATVFICRDGSSYKEKILRYMAYPLRVSASDEAALLASFVVITDKDDWTLSTKTTNGASVQTLHCGTLERTAVQLADFPDGSILFSLR